MENTMRKLMTLLVALIASTSAVQAQTLPGPATSRVGYWVTIGEAAGLEASDVRRGFHCAALIIEADEESLPNIHPPSMAGQFKAWPFNSRSEARLALWQSGWQVDERGLYVTYSQKGC
jgi:hypothetical protein